MSITMLELKFKLRDKVYIHELQLSGVVVGVYISDSGLQYQVRYFDDAKPQTNYFYEDEVEAVKK